MTARAAAPRGSRPPVSVEIRDLTRVYRLRAGLTRAARDVHALRGVDLDVAAGETMGLVGESGCGKTTLARCLVALERPTSGTIRVGELAVERLDRRERRAFCRLAQYVFQDPYGSLDPRLTVGAQVGEPLAVHGLVPRAQRAEAVRRLLRRVGLPENAAGRYPHEFSGGQRQRVGIARALAVEPRLLVADEPVSALDVSVQAQILNLLADLKEELGLTLVFISHDLHVVDFLCDRVAVMYLGHLVEVAPRSALFGAPRHPYTRALLAAAPSSRLEERDRGGTPPARGEPPNPLSPPPGCAFHPRCPLAEARCRRERPLLLSDGAQRSVACFVATDRLRARRGKTR